MARYGWRLTSGKATLEVRFNDTLVFSANATGIGFYTTAPVARPTVGAAVATTGSTTTTPYGYTTAAQADAIPVRINDLRTALLNLGLAV